MITGLIALITLLIGLLIGFYARDIETKVRFLYELQQEKRDRHEAGVVTPSVSRVTRHQPQIVDLTSETGGVMRPRPDTQAQQNIKERERKIRRRTP